MLLKRAQSVAAKAAGAGGVSDMKLDLTDMLYALSFALDKVEAELLGVVTGHGKRVAYLALLMGKAAGMEEVELRDFIGCCLLHDNALTEFIYDELSGSPMLDELPVDICDLAERNKPKFEHDHSVTGEENIRLLPFRTDVKNIILYHHENADGTGALGMTSGQTKLKAQILHLIDTMDATLQFHLEAMTPRQYEEMCAWVKAREGQLFSGEVVTLFLRAVTYDKIACTQGRNLIDCLHEELHKEVLDYSDEEVRNIARLFAKIVDYKSEFTQNHSRGVAHMAERMAHYYGFDAEKAIRFYFAGAMHDIGKLAIDNDILEKPGKLTVSEYAQMKDHAEATYYILSQMGEIPDIVAWASNHHEKLNGRGYPRGLTEKELSFEDQLMACIDIYRALRDERPYKDGLSHEKSIEIMRAMAGRGELNGEIIRDIDAVMGQGA